MCNDWEQTLRYRLDMLGFNLDESEMGPDI